ncbi:zinc protease [Devosia epidermidihirudinis]|uniref:Zinc protease n=1 Tax=Devosia epidermidihirudinis TaxID=1293439 RepID=A0A0F5Q428_9HYPH|nr:pitrilysin family protein [Devosia epidermidihirudinis]KKC35620.1 zinc protease [Devosia epidermidihirudinis]
MTNLFAFPRRIAGLVTVLSALVLAVPAYAEVVFQDVTSPKGINAWLVEDYSVPIITIRFAFEGGSTQDAIGKEGTANLLTALFDEGAGDLDSDAFQTKLDDDGAEMGFAADQDAVYGSMRMLADKREEAFGLLKLAIQEPRFDQNPIDRMRAQIVAGIIASAKDPGTAAREQWAKALFGDHPYARQSQGTEVSLASITADDLRAFKTANFARSNLHVGIVGAIDAKTAGETLDMLFGDLPEKPDLVDVPDIQPTFGKDLFVDYNLPQTAIYMAFPSLKREAPDFYAASLMNQILGGGGFSSRLTDEVREKRGLTYGISSSMMTLKHSNVLLVNTSTRSDRAAETLTVTEDVIARMAKDGPTPEELASAKKYAIGSYAINELSSSGSIANTLVGLQLRGLDIDYINERADLLNAVTIEDVKAVAAKLLSVKPTILLIGPPLTTAENPAPAEPATPSVN